MNIRQGNNIDRISVLNKLGGSNNVPSFNKEFLVLRKPTIYKDLLGLGKTNRPSILYHILSKDIVTKNTGVNK